MYNFLSTANYSFMAGYYVKHYHNDAELFAKHEIPGQLRTPITPSRNSRITTAPPRPLLGLFLSQFLKIRLLLNLIEHPHRHIDQPCMPLDQCGSGESEGTETLAE